MSRRAFCLARPNTHGLLNGDGSSGGSWSGNRSSMASCSLRNIHANGTANVANGGTLTEVGLRWPCVPAALLMPAYGCWKRRVHSARFMKAPDSALHGGCCSGGSVFQGVPASLSSVASSRSSRIRSSAVQNELQDGAWHMLPFQRESCHATRAVRWNMTLVLPPERAGHYIITGSRSVQPERRICGQRAARSTRRPESTVVSLHQIPPASRARKYGRCPSAGSPAEVAAPAIAGPVCRRRYWGDRHRSFVSVRPSATSRRARDRDSDARRPGDGLDECKQPVTAARRSAPCGRDHRDVLPAVHRVGHRTRPDGTRGLALLRPLWPAHCRFRSAGQELGRTFAWSVVVACDGFLVAAR